MEARERFHFVDGLRGIAALAVLVHHAACRTVCAPTLQGSLPGLAWGVLFNLNAGVDIFFVISGFVIAHSLRGSSYGPREVARFIVRRQLRLDPPYWVVVGAALLCGRIASGAGVAVKGASAAGVGTIAANLFYLQGLLRLPAVVDVAWTLCIEVQFYLAFIGLMAVARLRGRGTCGRPSRLARAMLMATAALSMCVASPVKPAATLLPYWCYFASGVLCYWVYRRQVGGWMLPALLAAGVASSFAVRHIAPFVTVRPLDRWVATFIRPPTLWQFPVPVCVGLATVIALYSVGRAGGLATVLISRPIQYFGAISYSLYLVHVTVLGIVTRGGARVLHLGEGWSILLLPVGVAASVAVAHLLHVAVERPSMRLAQSLKRREPAIGLPSDATAPAELAATV